MLILSSRTVSLKTEGLALESVTVVWCLTYCVVWFLTYCWVLPGNHHSSTLGLRSSL